MWSAELVIIESQRRIIKKNTKRGEEEEEGIQRVRVETWLVLLLLAVKKTKKFLSRRQNLGDNRVQATSVSVD